ncbi:SpoIIAA family protein [Defluviicoccus vanus]|uniref:STAS/SEC14 domain-containing protein n=1 Tax=Defluviicoccus vanus TaxID=111831 RepID=A0A7H1N717_9PROT|nr:STAS/SEC14 domain-containing protein [Defluviicoccus vanus]QNT71503.1 STAS/SEC14 domain-containing protein [Defluviicoccus vanus]
MIAVEVESGTIVITMTGIVSDADWDAAVLALEEKLGGQASVHSTSAKFPKRHVLMDWEKLEGWEKGARSTCTWFCMGNQDMIERLAVIGDERWRDETERLVDIYKNAQINFYLPAQREHAKRWLRQSEE